MRRITMLFFALLLFCTSAYAGENKVPVPGDRVERQAEDVRVVMYMTTW